MVVHLPIGFIITGLLLQWVDRKTNQLEPIIAKVFLWGFLAATLACISGYMLYLGEGYSFDTVKIHLWAGIATALFSGLMYLRIKEPSKATFLKRMPKILFSFSLLFLISFTGHLGGTITHGPDYLLEPLPTSIKMTLGIGNPHKMPTLEEANWEEHNLYADLVQPILKQRCISCHGPKKDKGELRLHDRDALLDGGKNGEVIKITDLDNSPLYTRLILPLDHEDHMPPKEKNQLSIEEIGIIKAWIETGSSFDMNIGELGLQKSLFTAFFPKENQNDYPDVKVGTVPLDTISAIKGSGLHIEPISTSSNFLRVSCINKPNFSDRDVTLLSALKEQLVYLDLGNTQITDAVFHELKSFPHLTTLKLDHTDITGKNIEQLQTLDHLRTLNLARTKFSGEYLSILYSFKKLKTVFLFNTLVKKTELQNEAGPSGLHIDFGHYKLPKIASDTIVY